MSYTSQTSRPKPGSMAVAIGLNGAIIVAVMLSPMVVQIMPDRPPTIAENVWVPLPPAPIVQQDKPVETPALNKVFLPDPMVDTHAKFTDPVLTVDKPFEGPIIALNGNGDDFRDLIKPQEIPKPIFKSAVRDPRYAKSFQPEFPVGLLQREIEGSVQIKVLIGTDGRVRQAIVMSASDPEFGRATQKKALSSWHFTPASRGGEAVEDWQVLTVRFDIN